MKLYEEDNDFVDCQNNNDDSDKYKHGNSGNDTIFWELGVGVCWQLYCHTRHTRSPPWSKWFEGRFGEALSNCSSLHYDYQWFFVGILPPGQFTFKTIFLVAFSFRQVQRAQVTRITVQEMVRFYGVMIFMSIEPRHLVGYEGYFKPT